VIDLSIEALHAAATEASGGLVDFGDPEYLEPLQVLLGSAEREEKADERGRALLRQICVRVLGARLTIRAALRATPAIRSVPVRAPIFIVGLPRTGSTLLHRLLALAADARAPLLWELMEPASPPAGAADERIHRAERFCSARPAELSRVHPMGAREPGECYWLLRNGFKSQGFCLLGERPSYEQWLEAQEMTSSYAHHRAALQLLLHARPAKRLVLKMPGHLDHLDALLAVYPDARIVHLHRDPLTALASDCSLWGLITAANGQPIDRKRIGARLRRRFVRSIDRGLAARRLLHPRQIVDVHYRALVDDPVATVRTIHRHFGLDFVDEHATRIVATERRLAAARGGPHRYTLSDYGLDAAEVSADFAHYRRAFGLERGEPRMEGNQCTR